MATRRLILVRHGERVDEPEEVLTAAGREQVRLTAARLATLPRIDRLVHSPMPRTVQTAGLLNEVLRIEDVRADAALAECTPAVPARHLLTDAQQAVFDRFGPAYVAAGAVQAATAVERYLTGPDEDRVELLVSHANLIRWLITSALGAGPDAWFQLAYFHCALSCIVLRPDRPPAVIAVNDATHLPAELRGEDHPEPVRW